MIQSVLLLSIVALAASVPFSGPEASVAADPSRGAPPAIYPLRPGSAGPKAPGFLPQAPAAPIAANEDVEPRPPAAVPLPPVLKPEQVQQDSPLNKAPKVIRVVETPREPGTRPLAPGEQAPIAPSKQVVVNGKVVGVVEEPREPSIRPLAPGESPQQPSSVPLPPGVAKEQ